jgi:uncharacterized protein
MLKKKWISIPLLFLCLLAAYALWWEPSSFVIRQETLRLPAWKTPLRVATLADLHVGSMYVGLDKLHRIVDQTNDQKPDLVVLLGDYVIGGRGTVPKWTIPKWIGFIEPESIAAELKRLNAPTYAVLGNHDRWFDGPRVEAALRSANITVLENRAVRIEHHSQAFWLGGISDLWTAAPDIQATLAQTNPAEPTILITHNPDIFSAVPSSVSLMIAGHTHGGQVKLPWFGAPMPVSIYDRGHIVEGGRHLFVTSGIGTSGPPIRFGAIPELVILSLLPGPM